MSNRIVTATVTGETIKLSEKSAGAAGSFNAVSLAFTFDSAWDGTTSKIVQFLDAYGANPVNITLSAGMIVSGAYIVPIPAEPLVYAGEMTVTVRGEQINGEITERAIVSATTTMKVLNSLFELDGGSAPIEPTPTQAEQLLAAVNSVTGMTATAITLATGSPATVVKTINPDSTINLEFGVPRGEKGNMGGLLPQLIVTVDSGSAVTVTNGITVYFGTSDGTFSTELSGYGTWNISATLNGKTASSTIVVDTIKIYSVSLEYYHIYGFTINEAESNPVASVTYTDEATSFTKGSAAWDTSPLFANIKPCLFNNGAVVGYLQRNDYTKFENGTTADITSGSAGDVMVEIPKMAYYMEKTGSVITCKVCMGSEAQSVDSRYTYLPFSRNAEGDRDKIYIGAYLGFELSSKLRSLSGKSPTTGKTIGAFRTIAQANGTGYQQFPFYQLTLIQILYIMKYGSLNSQVALGRGFVDGNAAKTNTGGANSRGFCYGEATGNLQMKLFGIEDFWGNLYQWIDGLFCNASWEILTTYKAFNDTGSGYLFSNSSGNSANTNGYMTKAQGGTQTGFNIKTGAGSETTYYADYAFLNADCLPIFGGFWTDASIAGAFQLYVSYSASSAIFYFGARLCYI